MSAITSSNTTTFRDSSIVISNVKRFLKSYNVFNLLNEEEFYRYISEVINQLGVGVMKEEDAFVSIEGSKGKLPFNFKRLYSAYKTTPFFGHQSIERLQSNSFTMTREVTQELLTSLNSCLINCCENESKVVEKITVKNFINEGKQLNFTTPILLKLSPNIKREFIEEDCQNLNSGSKDEITLDGQFIYTNFDKDFIYIKYYGFPIDKESGLPMIPNTTSVEKAIEWCIIYNTLLQLWYNNDVPDIQTKWQQAKQEYDYWFAQASYETKLPSFQTMIEKVRRNRGNFRTYQM